MGYETAYSLIVMDVSTEENYRIITNLMTLARELDGDDADILFALDEDGGCNQHCTWHESDEDMARYSKWFPKIVFRLDGEGEESEDMWVAYFHDGKMQKVYATITFEDFDPAKMVEVANAFNPLKPLEKETW